MNTPLVSICCVTYNHALFIRKCLDGFLMQETDFPVEILIHDDCSTDGTTEIIREYEAKYPDLIFPLYEEENQYQQGKAAEIDLYNYRRARGKYIAYFQAFTNTYAPYERLRAVYYEAIAPDYIVGLNIATRPDYLPEETIRLLAEINAIKPVTVELGLQTASDKTAKYINRCYPTQVYIDAARELNKRNIPFVTHIILGLPGETEEDYLQTEELVREVDFASAFTFVYSKRQGTKAAEMPDQIPEEIKQERLDRLMTMQSAISLKRNQARVGTVEKVLVTDVGEDGFILGRSHREAPETDGEIVFARKGKPVPEIGTFVNVKLTQADTYDLMGEML